MSNAVGGLMPVPAPARIFVHVSPSGGLRNQAAETFGLTDQTTSSSSAGRGENDSGSASSAWRSIRSIRAPTLRNARRPRFGRPSTNQPETDRRTGTPCPCSPVTNVLSASSDRKSTRLNSSNLGISYAVFCLKKEIRDVGFEVGVYGWDCARCTERCAERDCRGTEEALQRAYAAFENVFGEPLRIHAPSEWQM